jgi:hypothetical protein
VDTLLNRRDSGFAVPHARIVRQRLTRLFRVLFSIVRPSMQAARALPSGREFSNPDPGVGPVTGIPLQVFADVEQSRPLTLHQRCERCSSGAGVIALLVGMLVLIGWTRHVEPLMRIAPALAVIGHWWRYLAAKPRSS